jgi:hypothetical protein
MVTPFKKIDSDFISIMNGDDEGKTLKLSDGKMSCTFIYKNFLTICFALVGIFAWTTLNFLSGKLITQNKSQGRKKEFSSWEHNLKTKISCRPTEYFCANLHVHKHIVF